MILERPEPSEGLAEFCKKRGGSLTERVACNVMFQLTEVLKHCKNLGVLQRDVKPEDILIQSDTLKVKLVVFGCRARTKVSYEDFADICCEPMSSERQ